MADEAPLPQDPEALLEVFRKAEKPAARHLVGTEWERAGLLADTFEPAPFEGPRSIAELLARLTQRFGYHAEPEMEGGPPIALTRGRLSITLEPAGQLELSGAPLADAHATAAEVRDHCAEVDAIAGELGLVFLGLGFHPFATHADLPEVPKARYGVMSRYLPTRSPTGLDMMRRTQTVQTNLDFASEHDAMKKLTCALRVQPLLSAMYANSPWYEGRATGERSHRAFVWVHMDPDRSGLLSDAFHAAPSYASYVSWALDVPMFIVKRKDRILPATHLTFRRFMAEGLDGERATYGDWETHLNTLFPEARLKRTLELRGVDSQSRTLVPSLAALSRGLFYDERSLAGLEALVHRFPVEAWRAVRPHVAARGLDAAIEGTALRDLAGEVLDLARSGLRRLAVLDASGADESIHLAELAGLVERGVCPADARLAEVSTFDRGAVVRVSRA